MISYLKWNSGPVHVVLVCGCVVVRYSCMAFPSAHSVLCTWLTGYMYIYLRKFLWCLYILLFSCYVVNVRTCTCLCFQITVALR